MAQAARKLAVTRGRPPLTAAQLLRLVRFPAVRKAISSGLGRTAPVSVGIPGPGARYVHFSLESPKKFHKALFATISIGSRGTKAVIGTPLAHIPNKTRLNQALARYGWNARAGRWTRYPSEAQRRSMIYQFRRAGVIGGSRAQAILVPKGRVVSVVSRYLGRPEFRRAVGARANPILATLGIGNPRGRRNSLFATVGNPGRLRAPRVTLSVPEKHQLRIARDTLRMTPAMARVMGGMTHEEAREVIRRLGGAQPKRRNPRLSFEAWMREVDAAVSRRMGLSVYDLPDVPFRDWYDDGTSPRSAAARAIRAANENPRGRCPRGKVLSRRGRCVKPIGYRAKKGKLYGWQAKSPAPARHASLRRSIAADGWTTTIRRLYYLVNISHEGSVRSIARQDAQWMKANRAQLERRRVAANPRRRNPRARQNPHAGVTTITVPFRNGQKIAPARVRAWLSNLPDSPMKRLLAKRFEQNMAQYRRFHLGSEPRTFTYQAIPMGAQKNITDVDFVTSEGKEWAAMYQVPPHSRKHDAQSQGRFIHAHGESKIDLKVRSVASRKRLPERFHTPDGKFVGVIPGRVKITDWYRH